MAACGRFLYDALAAQLYPLDCPTGVAARSEALVSTEQSLRQTQHPKRRLKSPCLWAVAILLASVVPLPSSAQVLFVVVRDSSRDVPLDGALVSLLDGNGDLRTAVRTPDSGGVRLRASEPGNYAVLVERIGYRRLVSNWIPLGNTDTVEVTVRLSALPLSLAPIVIEAHRDSITPLLPSGIHPKTMAGRIFYPTEIERRTMGARDYSDVIFATGTIGLTQTLVRDSATKMEVRCIASTRSVTRTSRPECVLVLVNNVRMSPGQAVDFATPENLDFAIWLRPVDAGVLYGTGAQNGVLLLFTKDWRRARSVSRD